MAIDIGSPVGDMPEEVSGKKKTTLPVMSPDYVFGKKIPRPKTDAQGNITEYSPQTDARGRVIGPNRYTPAVPKDDNIPWPGPEGQQEPGGPYRLHIRPLPKQKPIKEYTPDEAAALVSYFESGNKNIPNYRFDSTHTAGGYFQITDTNWKNYGLKVGIDLSRYPTALSAPYDVQKQVFDRMYLTNGFKDWAPYNPRLAAALGGDFKAPKWVPTPMSIESEQARSGNNVVRMSPQDYLSLVDNLEPGESNDAKRKVLMQSLDKGEGIQSIPSLDVKSSGNNLSVLDYDGRNRAQAALDEGLTSIPVSVRGVPEGINFKNIKGTTGKVLPFNFESMPKLAMGPAETAQKIVPEAFNRNNVGQQAENIRAQQMAANMAPQATGPQPSIFDQNQNQPNISPNISAPTATGKPDFYPEIVAGINKDIISPTAAPYRGLMPPNPTNDVTAANRIPAANMSSAGNVGLASPSIASSLGSLLSNFNPIGSAQAAEGKGISIGQPTGDMPINIGQPQGSMPSSGISIGQPTGDMPSMQQPGFLSQLKQGIANAIPKSLADVPAPMMFPGMSVGDVAPIANMLSAAVRGPLAAGYGLGSAALQPNTNNWSSYIQNAAQNAGQFMDRSALPTTSYGEVLQNILSAPARAVVDYAKKNYPETTAAVAPYAELIGDVGLPGLAKMGAPALSAAGRIASMPSRMLGYDIDRARTIQRINRAYEGEMSAANPMLDETPREKLLRSQQVGSQLAPLDIGQPTGELNRLLGRAITKASPNELSSLANKLEGRSEGIRPGGVTPAKPTGGALERRTKATETLGVDKIRRQFGTRNFDALSDKFSKDQQSISKNLANAEASLESAKKGIALTAKDKRLQDQAIKRYTKLANKLKNDLDDVNNHVDALDRGIRFAQQTPFRIRQTLANMPTDIDRELYRFRAGEVLRKSFGKPQNRAGKSGFSSNMREIAEALYPTKAEAETFLRRIDNENLAQIRGDGVIRQIARQLGYPIDTVSRDLTYDIAQIAAHLGHSWWRWPFWAVRGIFSPTARQIFKNELITKNRANDILKVMGDSQAKVSADPNQLLEQLPITPNAFRQTMRPSTLPGLGYALTAPMQNQKSDSLP